MDSTIEYLKWTVPENSGCVNSVPRWTAALVTDGCPPFPLCVCEVCAVSSLVFLECLRPCCSLPKCLTPPAAPLWPSVLPPWVNVLLAVLGSRVADCPHWSLRKSWDFTSVHWMVVCGPWLSPQCFWLFSLRHIKLCFQDIYSYLFHHISPILMVSMTQLLSEFWF